MAADLLPRVISGVILAAAAVAAAILGGWAIALVALVLAAAVAWEWTAMTVESGLRAAALVALPALVAIALMATSEPWIALVIAAAGAIGAGIVLQTAWAAGGVVYATALGVGLVAIRGDEAWGLAALLFVFAVVWASDTGAYFAGRLIGGPKLWPRVSPKKTWSGFAGGTVAGVVAGVVTAAIADAPVTVGLVAVALVLSLLSVAGDLFESAVKRRSGVKDASHLIPGHGGVMDRVDGLTFAAAGAALIGALHGDAGVGAGLLLW